MLQEPEIQYIMNTESKQINHLCLRYVSLIYQINGLQIINRL